MKARLDAGFHRHDGRENVDYDRCLYIWLSVGNAGTDVIAKLLEHSVDPIALFHASTDESLLVLELEPG